MKGGENMVDKIHNMKALYEVLKQEYNDIYSEYLKNANSECALDVYNALAHESARLEILIEFYLKEMGKML